MQPSAPQMAQPSNGAFVEEPMVQLTTQPTVRPTAPLLAQRTAQLPEQPMVRLMVTFVGAANSTVGSAADGAVGQVQC